MDKKNNEVLCIWESLDTVEVGFKLINNTYIMLGSIATSKTGPDLKEIKYIRNKDIISQMVRHHNEILDLYLHDVQ